MNSFGECKRILNFNKAKCTHSIILRIVLLLFFIFININKFMIDIKLSIILKFIIIPYLIINIIVFLIDLIKMNSKQYCIKLYQNGIVFDDFSCLYKNLVCTKNTFLFGNTLILSNDFMQKKFNYYLSKDEVNYIIDTIDNAKYEYLSDICKNKVTNFGNLIVTIKSSKLKCFFQLFLNTFVFICCFATVYIYVFSFNFSAVILIIFILIFLYGFKVIFYFVKFISVLFIDKSIELYENGLITNNFICVYKNLTIETRKSFLQNELTLITDFQTITFSHYLKDKDYKLLLSKAYFINISNKKIKRSGKEIFASIFDVMLIVVINIVILSVLYYSLI